jgi:hypothetical protein
MELERLADAGETLDLVAKLGELVRAPRRLGHPAGEPERV